MVNQNKIFSFKIKRQAKNVFPRDVERTVVVTLLERIPLVPLTFNRNPSQEVSGHAELCKEALSPSKTSSRHLEEEKVLYSE